MDLTQNTAHSCVQLLKICPQFSNKSTPALVLCCFLRQYAVERSETIDVFTEEAVLVHQQFSQGSKAAQFGQHAHDQCQSMTSDLTSTSAVIIKHLVHILKHRGQHIVLSFAVVQVKVFGQFLYHRLDCGLLLNIQKNPVIY